MRRKIRSRPIQVSTSDMTPQTVLRLKETELETLHEGILRLNDLHVSADLTEQEYRTRLDRPRDLIVKKENEIQQLKEIVHVGGPVSDQERLQRIEELENVWQHLDTKPEEKNRLTKQVIERIEYARNGYGIDVRVKFR